MGIIVVDDSVHILQRQVRIHVCRLVKDNETHQICNIATTKTLRKANKTKVVIVTLTVFVLLRILLMLIQLLQNLLNFW
jgi:hypothetical protein